jgi:hypothetical protein
MAFSSTSIPAEVVGTKFVKIFTCSFAAVTAGAIKTGFNHVLFAKHNNQTTEADGKLLINIASDGTTAEEGSIYFSGFTANDVAQVFVYGY